MKRPPNGLIIISKIPLIKKLLEFVEEETELSYEMLVIKNRKREVVETRQIIMYCIWKNEKYSLAAIGHLFERDHSTVLHARKTITDVKDTQPHIKRLVNECNSFIKNYKKEHGIQEIKRPVTRRSVFKKVLDKYVNDTKEKKILIEKYMKAV